MDIPHRGLTTALALVAFIACNAIAVFGQCPPPGQTCEPAANCACPAFNPPNGFLPDQTPQIVFITFDDAVTISNYPIYEELISTRKNPNGANVTVTFFVTHEYNNYHLTNRLYREGHEIGLHTISHRGDIGYWDNLNFNGWVEETVEHKYMVSLYAAIPPQKIRGFRAPVLAGADLMYRALVEAGLEYDNSYATRLYSGQSPDKLYPHTNDYNVGFLDCPSCPAGNYPGFWTVRQLSLLGGNDFPCTMIDSCIPVPQTRNETFALMKSNFDNHYVTSTNGGIGNRAPFGIYTTAAWLQGDIGLERQAGFSDFLDYLGTLDDVYIVSISKGLEWMRNGVAIKEIQDFEPWKNQPIPPNECAFPLTCSYSNDQTPFPGERSMTACVACRPMYPWVGNPYGERP